MKELSTEEKAKAYDKALVIARSRYNIETEESVRICLELMFPELKESEDERIRENIIATIHLYYGEPLEDEAKEMIAWLEKQGEQKPAWSEEDEDKLNRTYEILPKCIDCHPIECKELQDWLKSIKGRVQPQPKQEWSEEDKRKLRKIFATFELYKGLLPSSDSEYIDHCLSWLKSLSPQNTWKPSDEQMEALEKVTNYSAFHDAKYCVELKRLLGQLKAL